MDPLKKQRVGYLVKLNAAGLTFEDKTHIKVFTPYNGNDPAYTGVKKPAGGEKETSGLKTVEVVGILESWAWEGGVGDPICISAYVSQEIANQFQAAQQTALKTTKVPTLAWWIVNFDEENKEWFEEAHPVLETITGQLNAPGKTDVRLAVASEPVKVASNIDVNVFNLYFEVVPGANETYDLKFATSSKMKFVKGWGLKVGSQAAAAMAAK
jgi:hypothetical protein